MSSHLRDAVISTCDAVTAVLAGTSASPGVDLGAATPCEDLDLRGLVEHFVGSSAALARLGLGEPLDPQDPWGGGAGAADGDWSSRLADSLDAIGRGWSRAEAWEGEAQVGSSSVPRSMLGEMALVEVAMHGWDLARTLGRGVELDPDVASAVHGAVARSAELGRQLGAHGPEVDVPDNVTGPDRAVGRAGRDPSWTA